MRKKYDKIFLMTLLILLVAGFFILFSASASLLTRESASFSKTIFKQFVFGLLPGAVLFLIFSKMDYRKWKKYALLFFLFSFFLALLVFIPRVGVEYGGAKRWINLGFTTFQPSELLKFSFIVYLASWIASRKNDIKSFKNGLMPFLIMTAFVGIVLILEPDIGTLGVIAITGALVFFIGGGKYTQMAAIFLLGLILLCGLALARPDSHVMARINVFLHPSSADEQVEGYQIKQSLIAIGSGGVFGRGLGMSIQKFDYLPESIGDSIFAVFAEEFGFLGSAVLIGLFLFFLFRGFKIVANSNDSFAKLLGSGIIMFIVIQSFINIASMIRMVPMTGVPLVFISQGGTALMVALASCGILLNISKKS